MLSSSQNLLGSAGALSAAHCHDNQREIIDFILASTKRESASTSILLFSPFTFMQLSGCEQFLCQMSYANMRNMPLSDMQLNDGVSIREIGKGFGF